jgi:hypothetical protein
MNITPLAKRLSALLVMVLLGLVFVLPAQAAPAAQATLSPQAGPASRAGTTCLPHKRVDFWGSQQAIEARGFNFDLIGDQASATFQRNLALDVASDPNSSAYTASRITEIDTWQPIAERVKCWQATPTKNVVVEFRVRFDQQATPAGMTENLMLWNAPFPSDTPEPARPVTTIGVSRNSALGAPMYVAVVTQDLDYATFAPPFVFQVTPMPSWLDPSAWHRVRITISQATAQIDVAQGSNPYMTVLKASLLHPAEPLGFELSVDNEQAPGWTVPVVIPDGLDVDFLDIRTERAR